MHSKVLPAGGIFTFCIKQVVNFWQPVDYNAENWLLCVTFASPLVVKVSSVN